LKARNVHLMARNVHLKAKNVHLMAKNVHLKAKNVHLKAQNICLIDNLETGHVSYFAKHKATKLSAFRRALVTT